MYTDFFSATTGTGSEVASTSDLPSDLQLWWLCQTPLLLTAALPALCCQDGTDTHTLKFSCCINTFLLQVKKQNEILRVGPCTSQKGQMVSEDNGGVVPKRSTCSRHTWLLSQCAQPKSEACLGFVQFCQDA